MELTTDHITKLQNSSDRKTQVESDNFTKLEQYEARFSQNISEISESLTNFSNKQRDNSNTSLNLLGMSDLQ